MDFISAIEDLKEKFNQRLKNFEKVEEFSKQIREKVEIKELKSINDVPLFAVDSSCDMLHKDFFGRGSYAIVVQGVSYIPDKTLEYVDFTNVGMLELGQVELFEEDEDLRSQLSTFGLCMEILHASKYVNDFTILMDGSVITFLAKINQAILLSKKYPQSELSQWFVKNYSEIIEGFNALIEKAVFIPKSSQRREFIESLGLNTKATDFEILFYLLRNQEYIILPVKSIKSLGKFDYDERINEIVDKIEKFKVVYYKPKGTNRVFKIEVFSTPEKALSEVAQSFILEGENILTYQADREAKRKLQFLKENFPLKNIWGYRI